MNEPAVKREKWNWLVASYDYVSPRGFKAWLWFLWRLPRAFFIYHKLMLKSRTEPKGE